MRPIATFLIGLPATGKTSYRKTMDAEVISTDDLIEQWAAEHGVTYSEAFRSVHLGKIERQMLTTFEAAVAAGKHVVIDRTNLSRKVRAKLLNRLPADYQRVAVVFTVPREELDRRLTDRASSGKIIGREVIDDMLERYQPPGADEFEVIIMV